MAIYNVDDLLQRLPGAHENGRANSVAFVCPLCHHDTAYALLDRSTVKFNCTHCFKSRAIEAALNLNGATVAEPPQAEPAPAADQAQNSTLRRPSLKQWQDQIVALGYRVLKDDPEYQKQMPAATLLEPLIEDLREGMEYLVAHGNGPPADLSEGDLAEELEKAARLAIEVWAGYLIWSNPVVPATTNGNLPAAVEIDRTPIDAYEACQIMQADQRGYAFQGFGRWGCTMVLSALMGAGKTTFAMNLARAWALGTDFLGRQCEQSKTLVVVSPKEFEAWADTIGFWQLREVIYLLRSTQTHFESGAEQARWFEEAMKAGGFRTFILDTLFDFYGMPPNARGDANRIAMAEQTPLLEVVNANSWCGLVDGHAPKSEAQAVVPRDPEEAFGGHTAWTAQHRMRMTIRRKSKGMNAFITGRGGYGDTGLLEERLLLFDEKQRLLTLGGPFSEYLGEAALPVVLEALVGGWISASEIIKATNKNKNFIHAGLKIGRREGKIQWNGVKGRGSKYALPEEPNEQEQSGFFEATSEPAEKRN